MYAQYRVQLMSPKAKRKEKKNASLQVEDATIAEFYKE